MRDNIRKDLHIWKKIDKEVLEKKCRALMVDGRRCFGNLDSVDAKERVSNGIYLCSRYHKGEKFLSHNVVVTHDLILKEAKETGCYLGLLQTKEEWEHVYSSVYKLFTPFDF